MRGGSTTALMAALIRAVHVRCDSAPILDDPYGERLIDSSERQPLLERFLLMLSPDQQAPLRGLADPARALDLAVTANPAYGGVVVRSRWSEDRLLQAIDAGVRQYIIVGSGLDTFALRRPAAAADVQIFEIDTAETLAMKRGRIEAAGLALDDRVHLAAADLETDGIGPALAETTHRPNDPSFLACLGVLPYLTGAGVEHLLQSVAACVAPGSEVVFDYLEPDAVATRAGDPELRRVRTELASSAESWRSGLDPASLRHQLAALGLTLLADLDGAALQALYATGHHPELRVPRRMHVSWARVGER